MSSKIYWNFLVLFGVLYQGFIGTLSEKYNDKSSELLIRQKRVINRAPGGDVREEIKNFPYVVSIKQFRGPSFCVGVILTQHIVLTVAKCVQLELEKYKVHSGSGRILRSSHPVTHNVTSKRTLVRTHPHRPADGIALITVLPAFIYSVSTKSIQIYEGYIEPGTLGTISGWGFNAEGDPGTAHPNYLRSITVPIISYQECEIFYLNSHAITERDICTLDTTGTQYCGSDDTGAPLVIKVGGRNQLVGVYLWNGRVAGQSNPDVFVNLRSSKYKTWIRETILEHEAYLNNPNQNQHLPNNLHNQQNLRHLHNLSPHTNIHEKK